ncbi:MAG: DNA polymerase Y family protein [Streptosporangiaceae bacterium]
MTAGSTTSSGLANEDRRVLAVRCPAWQPPSLVSRQTGQAPGPAARAFERVVGVVQEFCPRIEVLRPGLCAFGTRGPARYFGGEAELARKAADAVSLLGYDCGVGIADGLFAALLASRDSQREQPPVTIVPPGGTPAFLAPRAVTVLGEPDLADLLVRLGIRTLGEFAAVPAAEAGNRFGTQGLLAHRLARGLDPRPLAARPPAADLAVQLEFDPPAEQSERVVFAAKTLASQMHAQLTASGLACVRVQILVRCDNGEEISRLWRHDGLLSELAVAERVRWQLDGWRPGGQADEHDASSALPSYEGISLLRLVPDQVVISQGRQLGLWGDAVVTDRVARAAIRVQAMLGHHAVSQPVLAGGRSPADQAVLVPFGDESAELIRPADRPWPGQIPPPAPATVYQVPRQAKVTDGSGSLVSVTGRGHISGEPAGLAISGEPPLAVTAWTGPWPVTERWWDPERACRKARFQLVTADGSAWLAIVQDGRWLIEASYD